MTKLERLKTILAEMDGILVAFSGGVDSSLLLRVALEVQPDRVKAVTAVLNSLPPRELEQAQKITTLLKASHIKLPIAELDIPGFSENTPERCYYCKKELLTRMIRVAEEQGLKVVVEGSNADDRKDFRPGMRAIAELGVRSPLQEVGLTKSEIRELSRAYQLPTWDSPSLACLASRFPYGVRITKEGLAKVAAGEEFLHKLGIRQFRLRDHGPVARLEVELEQATRIIFENRQKIVDYLKQLGYQYICFDLEGYRTGSMNKMLG